LNYCSIFLKNHFQYISNKGLKQELSDIDNLTEERLDESLKDFKARELVADGYLRARTGWPRWS
jgi:hypothetical protein